MSNQNLKPGITLALIVKNEEQTLNTCLNAFAPIFDELLITDTGSTDKTHEIAKLHNAKILHFEWIEDFSAARNFTLEHVSTEWTMMIDADDFIEMDDAAKLLEVMKEPTFEALILPYIYTGSKLDPKVVNHQPRLWKTDLSLRFARPIHERLEIQSAKTKFETIPIIHKKQQSVAATVARNLRILEKHHSIAPRDAETIFYLGNEYFNLNQPSKAEPYFEKYLALDAAGKTDNKCYAYTKLGITQMMQGKIPQAKSNFEKAISSNPAIIESYLYLAEIEMNLFSPKRAVELLTIATQIKAPPKSTNLCNLDMYNGKANQLLQIAINKLSHA